MTDASRRIALIVTTVGLAACQKQPLISPTGNEALQIHGLSAVKDTSLRSTIQGYYLAESKRSWRDTYNYRSANFKEVVPFDTYVKYMNDSFQGWGAENLEIQSVACEPDECVVHIFFCEKFSPSPAKPNPRMLSAGGQCVHEPRTIWRRESGRWIGLDVGTRTHAPLNTNMADN